MSFKEFGTELKNIDPMYEILIFAISEPTVGIFKSIRDDLVLILEQILMPSKVHAIRP